MAQSFSVEAILKASGADKFMGAFKGAAKEVENFEKATKGVGDIGPVLKNVGDAMFGVGKSMSLGITAPVVGAVAASIKEFASLEQAVGGIETMFGKSADGVIKSSETAYKRAGVSGVEYMEQVTSFSASLLQGLGGDTEKAAGYADKAIVDMSDNANKFGTDIGMIQQAYQGFAKDNYTMLDNLKLGYGGTAGEMARLVNESGVMGDSFKATAENVKDIPFDQLIEAIHVTQEEMGITGTTAKEASETVSGSFDSMVAAAKNLTAGFGQENADIETLMSNLADTVGIFVGNIKRVLGTMWDNLPLTPLQKWVGVAIVSMGPLLMIVGPIVKAIGSIAIAFQNVTSFGAGMAALFPKITAALGLVGKAFAFLTGPVGLAIAAVVAVIGVMVWLYKTNEDVRLAIDTAWQAIKNAVATASQAVEDFIMQIWGRIQSFIAENQELIKSTIETVWNAIKTVVAVAMAVIVPIVTTAWEYIKVATQVVWEQIKGFVQVGVELILGIIKAVMQVINGDWAGAWETIKQTAETIWNIIKETASTVFGQIKEVITGVWNNVKEASSNIWNAIKSGLSSIWNTIKSTVSSTFNAIKTVITNAWNNVKSTTTSVWNSIKSTLSSAWSNIKSTVSNAMSNIKSNIKSGWDNVVSTVKTAGTNIIKAVKDAFNRAINAAKEFPSKAVSIGKDLIAGFVNGVKAKADDLVNSVKGAIGGAIDGAKNLLGINSPSKLFKQFGKWTDEGFINGIDAYAGKTKKAMGNMINGATSLFDPNALQFNAPSIGQLQNGLSGVNTNVNSRVDHIVSDNLHTGKQPAEINLNIAGRNFTAFVEDISSEQGKITDLELSF